MREERADHITQLSIRLQRASFLSAAFHLTQLGAALEKEFFYGEDLLRRLATTSILMQTRKDKPLFIAHYALQTIGDLYLHRYFETDPSLKDTILQTVVRCALKDSRPTQRALAVEILGQALNRVPYEKDSNLSSKAATALIKVTRNPKEEPRIREQALYMLDASISNLAFNPSKKIQSLATHFPSIKRCEATDKELQLLPHRIRSIRFKKATGVLPENLRVFMPFMR